MKRAILFLAFMPACGGAEFELRATNDAGPVVLPTETSQDDAGVPETKPEASIPEASKSEAVDAGIVLEATIPESAASDASTCGEPYACGKVNAMPPYTYCMIYKRSAAIGVAAAIQPCNTCGTFTCACIAAAAGCRYPTCSESGGQVVLTCDL